MPAPPTPPPKPLLEVGWADFLTRLHPSCHRVVRDKILAPGVEGMFLIVVADWASAQLGQFAAVVYGPDCTYKKSDLWQDRLVNVGSAVMRTMVCHTTRAMCLEALGIDPPPPAEVELPPVLRNKARKKKKAGGPAPR